MKQQILSILFLLLGTVGYSQIDSFDISSYYYPDIQRKQFSIRPLFLHESAKDNSTQWKSNLFRVNTNGNFQENTRKKNSYFSYDIRAGYIDQSFDRSKFYFGDNFYGIIFLNHRPQFYFRPKRFFEINTSVSLNFDPYHRAETEDRDEIFFDFRVNPKIGFGRIENVTDAWHALSIAKILQKAGCLSKDLSFAQISDIAVQISQLKNYRHVDPRLESIYEFENLLKYLVENSIAKSDDYHFIAILNDAYSFEAFRNREHGKNFTFGFDFDYRNYNYRTNTSPSISQTFAANLNYINKNALSEKWQFDQNYQLDLGIIKYPNLSRSSPFGDINVRYTLSYYLSRRTYFQIYPACIIENLELGENQFNILLNIGAFMRYYISPNVGLTLSADYDSDRYYVNPDFTTDRREIRVQIAVEYYVF